MIFSRGLGPMGERKMVCGLTAGSVADALICEISSGAAVGDVWGWFSATETGRAAGSGSACELLRAIGWDSLTGSGFLARLARFRLASERTRKSRVARLSLMRSPAIRLSSSLRARCSEVRSSGRVSSKLRVSGARLAAVDMAVLLLDNFWARKSPGFWPGLS
jgi:hypothetical protein